MKVVIHLIFVVLLSSLSFTTLSQDMSAMKKMMQKQVMDSCNDRASLACAGINKKKCTSSATKAMSACDHLFPKNMASMEAGMTAYGDCIGTNNLKNMGLSEKTLANCDAADSAQPMDREQGIVMLNQSLQQQATLMGTDDVTLPIYKNSTVMSHMNGSQLTEIMYNMTGKLNKNTLPALTLATPDQTSKIASYYRKKLKGFKEYKVNDGILLMENGPRNFDIMKDMTIYTTTPHIMITSMQNVPGAPSNTRSKIEIAYKK